MASLTQVPGDACAVATAVVRAEADACDRGPRADVPRHGPGAWDVERARRLTGRAARGGGAGGPDHGTMAAKAARCATGNERTPCGGRAHARGARPAHDVSPATDPLLGRAGRRPDRPMLEE